MKLTIKYRNNKKREFEVEYVYYEAKYVHYKQKRYDELNIIGKIKFSKIKYMIVD